MALFKKSKSLEVEIEANVYEVEQTVEEPKKEEEQWIWVDGFKGTEHDMTCRHVQYELGKQCDILEGEEIEECRNGFHMCLTLDDVFKYYPIGDKHRFFRVRALVRISDFNRYGQRVDSDINHFGYRPYGGYARYDKLVAKSIEFVSELTMAEIIKGTGIDLWDKKYQIMALELGIGATRDVMKMEKLEELGYSMAFAKFLISKNKFEIAEAVGSQPDLSMDMKVMLIMNT